MSGAHEFVVVQERDQVPTAKLVRIAVVSVVIGILSVIASGALLGTDQTRIGGGPAARVAAHGPVAPDAIGMIGQTLIEHEESGLTLRRAQRIRLESYGWLDGAHELAHIPIDRAIDLVVSENQARDGGTP
jgi:hypothetical protein